MNELRRPTHRVSNWPSAGGPQRSAPAAVGGPMGSRFGGGGRSAEYRERQEELEGAVTTAAQVVLHVLEHGIESAMREYNARE